MDAPAIRERAAILLATEARHPDAIAAAVRSTVPEVLAALGADWHTFRRVAGAGCWHWTLAVSPAGRQAQREVVERYAPGAFAPPSAHKVERVKGQLTATSAIGRALLAIGEGSLEELAAAAGCDVTTIRQQSTRFSNYLTVTRDLVQGPRRRRWRVVRIALRKEPAP